jgi:hypothetical protein
MPADEKTLQHDLELARADVLRGEAPSALGRLKKIQLEIDDLHGTSLWANYQLVYAGALGAMMDPGTPAAFTETFERISELKEGGEVLAMRAHEGFAKFLVGSRSPRIARDHYQKAARIAEELGLLEEIAHYELCVISIDLEEERSPHRAAFHNLKQAAKSGYTAIEQSRAWIHYLEEIQEFGGRLLAARKGEEAEVGYFRGLLSKIRRNPE